MQNIILPKVQKMLQFNSNVFTPNMPSQLQHQEDLKNASNKHTQAFQQQNYTEKYQTRSLKSCTEQQISFEHNFMAEHYLANQREFCKYIEFQDQILQRISNKLQTKRVIYNENTIGGETYVDSILKNSSTNLLNLQQIERFVIDLRREQKLKDFLEYIAPRFDEEAKLEILCIANKLWEEYLLIQQNGYVYHQFVEFAKDFVERQIKEIDEKLKNINFKQLFNSMEDFYSNINLDKLERFNKFKQFVMYLCMTLTLIIGGFFDNPYLSKEQGTINYKRGISSIESADKFNFGQLIEKNDEYSENDEQNQKQYEQNGLYLQKRLKSQNY